MSILDETQDLLCKKLTSHFTTLCLEAENNLEDPTIDEELKTVLFALLNLKWLLKAFDILKEQSEKQLQEVVHSVMTICLGEQAYIFAYLFITLRVNNLSILKTLPHSDFLSTLDLLCEQFLKIATRSRKIITLCTSLLATIPIQERSNTSSSSSSSSETPADTNGLRMEDVLTITTSERDVLQQTLQSIHLQSWSHIQQHIGVMLETRSEIHSQLSITDLKEVWDHCIDFIMVATKIYGVKGKLLLSTLLRQARASLEYLHKNQTIHLQSLLHEELWKPALVPSNLQNEVTALQENARVSSMNT